MQKRMAGVRRPKQNPRMEIIIYKYIPHIGDTYIANYEGGGKVSSRRWFPVS